MNRDYHQWHSPQLNRSMEMLVFGHAGTPVLVFPARQGRFYDYENWGLIDAVGDSIRSGRLQLFCVDSLDSETFYSRSPDHEARIRRYNQYEQYILNEVLPLIRMLNQEPGLTAHGCSIGAYHAANLALRHPHHFARIVALSGRYDLTRRLERYPDVFDGYYSQDIYFHTPNHFVPNLSDASLLEPLRRMSVVLAVGESDYFRESNAQHQ